MAPAALKALVDQLYGSQAGSERCVGPSSGLVVRGKGEMGKRFQLLTS